VKGSSQFLALQRLTRHRFHLVHTLASEKNWMLSNIYLKFSELAVKNRDKPFSNIYGATSCAALTEFYSLDEIVYKPIEDLSQFVVVVLFGIVEFLFIFPHSRLLLLPKRATN